MKEFTNPGGSADQKDAAKAELLLENGVPYPLPGKYYARDRQVDLQTGTLRIAYVFPNPAMACDRDSSPACAWSRSQGRSASGAAAAVMELQGHYQVRWSVPITRWRSARSARRNASAASG